MFCVFLRCLGESENFVLRLIYFGQISLRVNYVRCYSDVLWLGNKLGSALVIKFTFQCCENNLLYVSCIFSLCSRVKLLLFIISLTVHRKTNFLVNVYWDIKYSDSDSDKRNSPVKYMPHLQMEWNPPKFKILGIWFTNDLKECEVLSFSNKFSEI